MENRVLVSGGRWFHRTDIVHNILSRVHARHPIEELYEGGATGADELCKLWALAHNIPVVTVDAEWKLFGNRAGGIRNAKMLRIAKPRLAIVFPGGNGTADMLARLHQAKIPTMVGRWTDVEETDVSWSIKNG